MFDGIALYGRLACSSNDHKGDVWIRWREVVENYPNGFDVGRICTADEQCYKPCQG